MEEGSAGSGLQPPHAGIKRSRSPELKLAQLRRASGVDDVLTDNLRSQKRYLSQVSLEVLQSEPVPVVTSQQRTPQQMPNTELCSFAGYGN